jgi:hypothetical protein
MLRHFVQRFAPRTFVVQLSKPCGIQFRPISIRSFELINYKGLPRVIGIPRQGDIYDAKFAVKSKPIDSCPVPETFLKMEFYLLGGEKSLKMGLNNCPPKESWLYGYRLQSLKDVSERFDSSQTLYEFTVPYDAKYCKTYNSVTKVNVKRIFPLDNFKNILYWGFPVNEFVLKNLVYRAAANSRLLDNLIAFYPGRSEIKITEFKLTEIFNQAVKIAVIKGNKAFLDWIHYLGYNFDHNLFYEAARTRSLESIKWFHLNVPEMGNHIKGIFSIACYYGHFELMAYCVHYFDLKMDENNQRYINQILISACKQNRYHVFEWCVKNLNIYVLHPEVYNAIKDPNIKEKFMEIDFDW